MSGFVTLCRVYDVDANGDPAVLRYPAGAPVPAGDVAEMSERGVPMAQVSHGDGGAIRAAISDYESTGKAPSVSLSDQEKQTGAPADAETPAEDKAVRGPREAAKPKRRPRRKPAEKAPE